MKTKQTKSAEIRSILSQLTPGDSVSIPACGAKRHSVRSAVSSQAKALGITVTSSLSPNRKFLTVSRPVVVGPPKENGEWKLYAEAAPALKAAKKDGDFRLKTAKDVAGELWKQMSSDIDSLPDPSNPAITVIQKRLEKAKATVKFYEDLLAEAKGA